MAAPSLQPKPNRRSEILNAARRCFAKSGFHQASIQDICTEAGMSPGNLYRYFPSKEALIAGIAESDRADARANFAAVTQAPDFFAGLAALARQYLVERTPEEIGLCSEIMAESRRNPGIARIYQAIDVDVKAGLLDVLRKAAERGEIPRDLDFEGIVVVLLSIGDGIEWRRAVDPSFDPESVLPLILKMVRCLLSEPAGDASRQEETHR